VTTTLRITVLLSQLGKRMSYCPGHEPAADLAGPSLIVGACVQQAIRTSLLATMVAVELFAHPARNPAVIRSSASESVLPLCFAKRAARRESGICRRYFSDRAWRSSAWIALIFFVHAFFDIPSVFYSASPSVGHDIPESMCPG